MLKPEDTSPDAGGAGRAAVGAMLDSLDQAAEAFPDAIGRGAAVVVVQLAPDGEGVVIDYGARTWFQQSELAAVLREVLARLEAANN